MDTRVEAIRHRQHKPFVTQVSYVSGKMLHKSLSADEKVELTQAFGQFDIDGDGSITVDELRRVLAALRVDVSEEEVSRMMRAADLDGNGTIDLDEFLAINARAEHQLAGDVEKEVRLFSLSSLLSVVLARPRISNSCQFATSKLLTSSICFVFSFVPAAVARGLPSI